MKKQTVVIIVASALLLLVVGSVIGFRFLTEKNININKDVFECLSSDIVSYSVDNNGKEYKLVRHDGGWCVENSAEIVIDNEKAENLIRCATKITANGIVKDPKKNPEEKEDIRVVKIGLSDGSEFLVTFISETADMCMFGVSGQDEIYSMYKSVRDILTPSLGDLMILEVFEDFDDSESLPELYEYTDYDKTKVSVRVKTGWELSRDDKNQFVMTEPYYRSVDDEKFAQQILVKIPAITRTGSHVADTAEDLSIYGLDEKTRAILKLKRNGKEEILYLGKIDNGLVYAQKNGQNDVFTITSSQLEFLQTEPFYFIDSRLLESDFSDINRVSVRVKNEIYELKKNTLADGGVWFSINGKNANKETFDEIIALIDDVEVVSELKTVPQNTRDIIVRFYYSNSRGYEELILVPFGEREYAVFVGNAAEFAVEKQKIDEIIERIKK